MGGDDSDVRRASRSRHSRPDASSLSTSTISAPGDINGDADRGVEHDLGVRLILNAVGAPGAVSGVLASDIGVEHAGNSV